MLYKLVSGVECEWLMVVHLDLVVQNVKGPLKKTLVNMKGRIPGL